MLKTVTMEGSPEAIDQGCKTLALMGVVVKCIDSHVAKAATESHKETRRKKKHHAIVFGGKPPAEPAKFIEDLNPHQLTTITIFGALVEARDQPDQAIDHATLEKKLGRDLPTSAMGSLSKGIAFFAHEALTGRPLKTKSPSYRKDFEKARNAVIMFIKGSRYRGGSQLDKVIATFGFTPEGLALALFGAKKPVPRDYAAFSTEQKYDVVYFEAARIASRKETDQKKKTFLLHFIEKFEQAPPRFIREYVEQVADLLWKHAESFLGGTKYHLRREIMLIPVRQGALPGVVSQDLEQWQLAELAALNS